MPSYVSETLSVPNSIAKPPYTHGPYFLQERCPKEAEIKSPEQIRLMRKSCYLARQILDSVSKYIQVNISM